MIVSGVITRLSAEVDALGGRVQGLAELAALVRDRALPNVTPAAYVVPAGLRGGEGDASAGAFTQMVDEVVSVVLVVKSHGDPTGGKALATFDALIADCAAALAGWAPANQVGVFRLQRGAMVSLEAGTAIYQLDFAIRQQLRIMS